MKSTKNCRSASKPTTGFQSENRDKHARYCRSPIFSRDGNRTRRSFDARGELAQTPHYIPSVARFDAPAVRTAPAAHRTQNRFPLFDYLFTFIADRILPGSRAFRLAGCRPGRRDRQLRQLETRTPWRRDIDSTRKMRPPPGIAVTGAFHFPGYPAIPK